MTDKFKIERNIPVPTRFKSNFADMEIGDSVFVAHDNAVTARATAHQFGHRNARKFVSRTVEGGARIWRVK